MDRYEVIIFWSNEDQAFVGEIPELPGCMAHGSTHEEASPTLKRPCNFGSTRRKNFRRPGSRATRLSAGLCMKPFRIAVLISGGGTTLLNLLGKIAAGQLPVEIAMVLSSSPTARGLQFATDAGIPSVVIERKSFAGQDDFSRGVFDRAAGPASIWW